MVRATPGPAALAQWMSVRGVANSRIRWRQAPQGVRGSSVWPSTRMAAMSRYPAQTMAAMAAVSAQTPEG